MWIWGVDWTGLWHYLIAGFCTKHIYISIFILWWTRDNYIHWEWQKGWKIVLCNYALPHDGPVRLETCWSLNFICRRFGTLFHLHRQVGVPTCLWRWKRQSVPERWYIKFRRRGITRKKAYNIQNTAKVWNQECWSLRIKIYGNSNEVRALVGHTVTTESQCTEWKM
jgi:hypothetical protein